MTDMSDAALSQPEAYHGAQAARATPAKAWTKLMKLIDSGNIAEDMTDEQRGRLGEKVKREFEVDIGSRDAAGGTEAGPKPTVRYLRRRPTGAFSATTNRTRR